MVYHPAVGYGAIKETPYITAQRLKNITFGDLIIVENTPYTLVLFEDFGTIGIDEVSVNWGEVFCIHCGFSPR